MTQTTTTVTMSLKEFDEMRAAMSEAGRLLNQIKDDFLLVYGKEAFNNLEHEAARRRQRVSFKPEYNFDFGKAP